MTITVTYYSWAPSCRDQLFPSSGRHITFLSIRLKFYHSSSTLQLSVCKFDPYPLVQDDLQRRMLLRGAYGLSLRSLIGRHLLQLTALPWTTEASTSERWQFRALTNRKATSSNRGPSLSSLYYYVCILRGVIRKVKLDGEFKARV